MVLFELMIALHEVEKYGRTRLCFCGIL